MPTARVRVPSIDTAAPTAGSSKSNGLHQSPTASHYHSPTYATSTAGYYHQEQYPTMSFDHAYDSQDYEYAAAGTSGYHFHAQSWDDQDSRLAYNDPAQELAYAQAYAMQHGHDADHQQQSPELLHYQTGVQPQAITVTTHRLVGGSPPHDMEDSPSSSNKSPKSDSFHPTSYTSLQSHPSSSSPPTAYTIHPHSPSAFVLDPDYVIAMHDFAPIAPNTTCLSFRAGEIIHVLNRDETGWWDGELEGRRGWFPSNYVTTASAAFTLGMEAVLGTQETLSSTTTSVESLQDSGATIGDAPTGHAGMSSLHDSEPTGFSSIPSSSTSRMPQTHRASSSSRRSKGSSSSKKSKNSRLKPLGSSNIASSISLDEPVIDRRDSCPPMMIPMVHALSLLQNAVRAHRVTHFQPSTACIISCVRSVLSTCECLSKESEWLLRFPKLASQRKKVLNELARLVNQARKASESVIASGTDRKPYKPSAVSEELATGSSDHQSALSLSPEKVKELHDMLRLGDSVYQHVRKFLLLAVEVGVELPPDRMFPGFVEDSDPGSSAESGPSHRRGASLKLEDHQHNTPLSQPSNVFDSHSPNHARNGSVTSTSSPQASLSRRRSKIGRKGSNPSLRKRGSRDSAGFREGRHDSVSTASSSFSPARKRESGFSARSRDYSEFRRQKGLVKHAASSTASHRDDETRSVVSSTYATSTYSAAGFGPQIPSASVRAEGSSSRKVPFHSSQYNPSQENAPPNQYPLTYRKPKYSISSVSSASSYDSGSQNGTPVFATDHFPTGQVTTAQALVALRLTHDRLLSVIAAFIGHIHSHSRSSHASSKGHLIEMTRKTVDQVRYLLTLVDAVEETPEIQRTKPREVVVLKTARVQLYGSTNQIVEAVKDMLSHPQYVDENGVTVMVSEEDEKNKSLQAATGTLRAGGECVTSVKLALSRSIGEEPFVIYIAPSANHDSSPSASTTTTPTHTPISAKSPAGSSPEGHPPRTMPGYRRTHGYTQSQTYPHPAVQAHSHSASLGGTPTADLPFIPARRFSDRSVDESVEEETVRLPALDEDPTLHVRPSQDVVLIVEPPIVAPNTAEPSSRSSASTNVSQLSMINSEDVSPRTSLDGVDASPAVLPQVHLVEPSTGEETSGTISGMEDIDGASVTMARGAPSPTTSSESEGGERLATASALEEKIIRGDLPSLPMNGEFMNAASQDSIEDDQAADSKFGADYDPRDAAFNAEGMLVGATLEVLVAKMTPYNRTPDSTFCAAFYLTFRLFTTSTDLVDALLARYDLQPPVGLSSTELAVWRDVKVLPIRLRVSNVIKTWLELHWRSDTDDVVLPTLEEFAKTHLNSSSSKRAGARILELIKLRSAVRDALSNPEAPRSPMDRAKPLDYMRTLSAREGLTTASVLSNGVQAEVPTPIMNRTIHKNLTVGANTALTDLDELEVARQLTIYEFSLYAAIPAEELVELGQSGAKPPVHVKAISTFSTAITGWVTESILNEQDQKKRASLLKYFIKVADRCVGLNNFSTMRSILAALDSSTISRLTKTWTALSSKYKMVLESMRKLADHARNYGEYRQRLRLTTPPAVPFLGLYLTDITFCREGNPSTRPSPLDKGRLLINFMKYHRLARIIQDVQRFQKAPYNLLPLPEMQKYLRDAIENGKNNGDLQDLYRRSLVIEPRQAGDSNGPDNKAGKEWLGWTRSALSSN